MAHPVFGGCNQGKHFAWHIEVKNTVALVMDDPLLVICANNALLFSCTLKLHSHTHGKQRNGAETSTARKCHKFSFMTFGTRVFREAGNVERSRLGLPLPRSFLKFGKCIGLYCSGCRGVGGTTLSSYVGQ